MSLPKVGDPIFYEGQWGIVQSIAKDVAINRVYQVFTIVIFDGSTYRLNDDVILELPTPAVVAYGNPFDGLELVGPFPDSDKANDYADVDNSGDWWVISLITPGKP